MAKSTSNALRLLSRLVKGVVSLLLIPPVVGFARGIAQQLGSIPIEGQPSSQWFVWGLIGYIGLHLLLCKPRALFRVNHAWLSRIAVWVFGGQVSTVGTEGPPEPTSGAKAKRKRPSGSPGGLTLVVLSPYLVPLFVILMSLVWWLATRWMGEMVTGLAVFSLGASLAFHIAMTAEDLQQDHERFPIETYLMALVVSSLSSLLVLGLCAPMVLPAFSILGAFAEAAASAQAIYTGILQTLFW